MNWYIYWYFTIKYFFWGLLGYGRAGNYIGFLFFYLPFIALIMALIAPLPFVNDNKILIYLSCSVLFIFINEIVQAVGKIAELQGLCNSILKTDLKIDNIWGEQTNNAVKKLPLCGLLYVQRELTTWVQLRLGETADGIFGIKTERAVKTWQRDHNIMVDGIVGYNTYKSLALA